MDIGAWIGLWTFIGMFIFLMLGVPIFICLFTAAFVGFWLIGGPVYTLQQFSSAPYHITSSYTFAVVPLFLLMSVMAANCGIAKSAYDAAYKWLGRFRGGLLMVTVGSAAIFGASCGSSLASAAVFAKTALPELEKYKYDKSLAMGCIVVSGSLASLIPPSIGIIIVCILVDGSIGRSLVAGIIPGVVFAMMLIFTILVLGFLNPKAIPKLDLKTTWKERFLAIRPVFPVVLVIMLIIGGMYLGVFPPTSGGAIGSMAVLVIVLLRKVGFRLIADSFSEAVILNVQLFPLIISGFLFARFIALSELPNILLQMIIDAQFPPLGLMAIVILFYLFIGCVLEFLSMTVITLPIVYPLLTGVGFDPIAIIIVLVFLSEISLITPPIGMNAFLVAGVAEMPAESVFKGVIPFFLVCILMLILLVLFPGISTWLPNLFYGQVLP